MANSTMIFHLTPCKIDSALCYVSLCAQKTVWWKGFTISTATSHALFSTFIFLVSKHLVDKGKTRKGVLNEDCLQEVLLSSLLDFSQSKFGILGVTRSCTVKWRIVYHSTDRNLFKKLAVPDTCPGFLVTNHKSQA